MKEIAAMFVSTLMVMLIIFIGSRAHSNSYHESCRRAEYASCMKPKLDTMEMRACIDFETDDGRDYRPGNGRWIAWGASISSYEQDECVDLALSICDGSRRTR